MANRLARNPGELASVTAEGRISSAPDFVVSSGEQTGAALEGVGAMLSNRIGRMADKAAAREGEQAGMAAGAAAGQKFIEKTDLEAQGASRASAKPAAPGKVTVAAPGASPLNGAPLALRQDGTIRGEAFDAAAIKSYGWRMQTGLATDLAAAYDQFKDDPAGYEGAIGNIRQEALQDSVMAEGPLREGFEQLFAEKVSIGRLSVASRHEARLKAQAAVDTANGLETMRKSIERDAYLVGGNPAGDANLEAQLARVDAQIDASIGDGTLSAAEGAKYKKALKNTVFAARTQGTFDALPTPEAQADFALGIMEEYASGKGPYADLGLDEAKSLSNELFSSAVRNQTAVTSEQKKAAAALETKLEDDIAAIAATGHGLEDPDLTADRVSALLGSEAATTWIKAQNLAQQGWQSTAGMELETPQELAQRLEALKPKPGAAGAKDQQKIYDAAAKKAAAVLEERETDPLGQASRAKMIDLTPIDTSSPQALSTSFANRRIAAEAVAREYGVPAVIFRPEERKALSQALIEFPELLPGFATTLTAQLGDLAPKALAEISEAGPELAHVAGVAMATGDPSIAMDIAETLKARKEKRSAKPPSPSALADAAGAIAGPALGAAPGFRSSVLGTANLLLEHEAARLGFDVSEVNKPGTQAYDVYARVIDQALGARLINGQKWGGLSEVNGRQIVAPSFMPANDVAGVLGQLRDEDLKKLPPIQTGNGILVTSGQIRGGQLVSVGDGQYRVALGDPDSFDPQWLMNAAGDYWVLDFDQLRTVIGARPKPLFDIGMFGVGTMN